MLKTACRTTAIGVVCVATAWAVAQELVDVSAPHRGRPGASARAEPHRPASPPAPSVSLFSHGFIDDSGYNMAYPYIAPIGDRGDLKACLAAAQGRADRGIAELRGMLERLQSGRSSTPGAGVQAARLETYVALLHMYEGRFVEVDRWVQRAIATLRTTDAPPDLTANLIALRGVAALRRGETENCIGCLGPSSCILPIAGEAIHTRPEGSRAAFGYFLEYLRQRPEDYGVRWLLNVAAMTLGEYPDKVPDEFRIALGPSGTGSGIGRFRNVAPLVGLDVRGPNRSGGSVFDDFDGDGRPDIMTTTTDWDLGASLFLNNGDGTFRDWSKESGLDAHPMALNLAHADFNNDGRLDVVIVRGGWEDAYPISLLRNEGGGRFKDVTAASGLGVPIASKSAAWGDYDNDGDVDLYVAGEYSAVADRRVAQTGPVPRTVDPRNLGRLYRNNGDGSFTDVAEKAGVLNARWAHGAVWGDYDDDGRIDLYISNSYGAGRLYHNNGDGTFTDVAPDLGVTGPQGSFACWFWDYDNDGRLDLYVNASFSSLHEFVLGSLGRPTPGATGPRLYRNLGREGFRDVTAEVGLDRVIGFSMGSNVGDVDNDGYLDVYLGTGRPEYSALIPNIMLRNVAGRRFEDVTLSSGTGHLQKGHGVSFADYDDDGDLDLFVETGGATPGDRAHNLLFQNPGNGRHWLAVRLVGTRSNRAALGAKIRVDLGGRPGAPARSVYRRVGPGASFGGNSLTAWIGLGDARSAAAVTVEWPRSKTRQTVRDVPADRTIEIVEGVDGYRVPERRPGPEPRQPGISGGLVAHPRG